MQTLSYTLCSIPTCVEHVWHEGHRVHAPNDVHHVNNHRWEGWCLRAKRDCSTLTHSHTEHFALWNCALTRVSVMIVPEADQEKTSIWPGVSKITCLLNMGEKERGRKGGGREYEKGELKAVKNNFYRRSTYLCSGALFSMKPMTWSKRVANRFSEVTIPPLGPSPYCFITSL